MQETLRQAKVVGSRIVRIGQQGHSVPLEISQIILSRILTQALCFVRSGAVDHERGGASPDRENHLWGAYDAHPLLRTARSSVHRMATVIEVDAVFSAGSRPALKTMGLPDRGWSVGSMKSEQLHDVKSVITVTFAMCQTVKSLRANLIFGGKIYKTRPAGPHQENVYVDNTPNHWQTSRIR